MDYTSITSAVDWAAVLTGIAAIAALLMAVKVGVRGAKILLGFVRG